MFIYNFTFKVSNSIAGEWMQWQLGEHIPEIMFTGLFEQYKIFRLLEQDETEGQTFIIQYYTVSKENYEMYVKKYAAGLTEKAFAKWGDAFIAFKSLLQSVH